MSKMCLSCNSENIDFATECEVCGTKFGELNADKRIEKSTSLVNKGASLSPAEMSDCTKPHMALVSVIAEDIFEVPDTGVLIGRESDNLPDLFRHKWVSDPHCRLTIDGGNLFVEDIGGDGKGSTNGTYVNGKKVPARKAVRLYDGDSLKIAHLMFTASIVSPEICTCEDVNTDMSQLSWVVDCPVCGMRYEVDSVNAVISECDECDDKMEKREIAKVRPKQVKVKT